LSLSCLFQLLHPSVITCTAPSRALSASIIPGAPKSQLSCFIQSRQGVTSMSKKYFGMCLNRMTSGRMRKTRKHCILLACVVAWFGDFAWTKKFVFFFCMEGSFFWLPRNNIDSGCRHLERRDNGIHLIICDISVLVADDVGWWYSRGANT